MTVHVDCGCPLCESTKTLPGRCPRCCHHTRKQGHRTGCPTTTTRRRPS